jgi:hypothetical protein
LISVKMKIVYCSGRGHRLSSATLRSYERRIDQHFVDGWHGGAHDGSGSDIYLDKHRHRWDLEH